MQNDANADLIIAGFGIAGATLALALDDLGLSLAIYDADLDGSSSKVAAGLITPVTGKKLKPQPHFETLYQSAVEMYRSLEDKAGSDFLYESPALRLLTAEIEHAVWERERESLSKWLSPSITKEWSGVRWEGTPLQMPLAARLDTRKFLHAAQRFLAPRHSFFWESVDSTDAPIVWCCGFHESKATRVDTLGWRPAKGEILRVKIPDGCLPGTVHARGMWVTPTGGSEALAGATYSWDALDGNPTSTARDALVEKLLQILEAPFEVVGHEAGVRPIVSGRKPIIGSISDGGQQWLFNGLGSKGALFGPTVARLLAEHIVNGAAIPADYDWTLRRDTQ